jgi:RIO kinase 1
MARITHERWKVFENVFDQFTIKDIIKLTKQQHFDNLVSPISIGKEANIFSAIHREQSIYRIVKIYRLEACNFNKMYDYIKHDPRYFNIKKQRRQVIFSWVQREVRNLMKARKAGCRVPMPITLQHHIIVMKLIGNEKTGAAAQRLKQASPKDPQAFFDDLVKQLSLLYKKAKLVHGDLSEYNILNYKEKPVIIDMSQSSPVDASNAEELLDRDIRNMVKYFGKHGVKTSAKELKQKITGKKERKK